MSAIARPDLERFQVVTARRLGLQFDTARLDVLSDVLRQRLDNGGESNPEIYLASLAGAANAREELRVLATLLTVTETYFFRVFEHFRALVEVAIPARMGCAPVATGSVGYPTGPEAWGRAFRPLQILSAGCASGEEPYSLAIMLLEHFPEIPRSSIRITGIDLNRAMLAKAREGRYSAWSLREVRGEIRGKYFRAEDGAFVLDDGVRSMVSWQEGNLGIDDGAPWGSQQYDIIFCRNVIMYLAPEAVRLAVTRLTRALAPGGFLFLSPAETLRGLSQDFHLRHTHETFYYQKREDGGALAPPPAAAPMPVVAPVPVVAPILEAADTSWVDAVRGASERIERLWRGPGKPGVSPDEPPGGTPGTPRHSAARLGVILELLAQERHREALEALRSLPPEMVTDADVQLLHAVLLANCGDVAAAADACRQLLASDDLNAAAHYLAALCYERGGDWRAAAEHDQAAIYLDPAFAMPHLHLGLLVKRAGNLATARCEFEQAGILLPREDASRILLLGGGFSRETLLEFVRTELRSCGGRL